jgi:[acyl-carrier-protein] S-malonyltransferase
MQPAAAGLAAALASTPVSETAIPVIGNIQATPLHSAAEIRAELAQQVAASVQWIHTVEYLVGEGITTFIEIGPGQALSGMVKRIAKGVTLYNVSNAAEIAKVASSLRSL